MASEHRRPRDRERHAPPVWGSKNWLSRRSGNPRKLIVVDRDVALVGSANLTGHAMDRNLECSVLLHGGPHPEQIHGHIRELGRQRRVGSAVVRARSRSPAP
jgi:hypothetical protein